MYTVKQLVAQGEVVEDKKLSKSNWQIMVAERTQLKFSNFFKAKSGMVEPMCEQFFKWIKDGFPFITSVSTKPERISSCSPVAKVNHEN